MGLESLPAWLRGRVAGRRNKKTQKDQRRAMFFEGLENRSLMAVDAFDDTGVTTENATLTVVAPGATTNLLANDTGGPLTVYSFQATSAQGAAVNVNTNGTFSYNPLGAAALQQLTGGQSVVDSFTYTATDGTFNNTNLNWDFGTANLQGWTVLNGAVFFRPDEGGGLTPANSGGGFAHDPGHTNLLVQSPEFQLSGGTVDGTNALVVEFVGGAGDQSGGGQGQFPTPASAIAYNGGVTNSSGQKALAFLNTTTGQYITKIFENDDGGQNIRSFTFAQLQGFGLTTGQNYRLHYFENDDGGWGWGQLNFVQVAASVPNVDTATVNVTVNGVNEAPVAAVNNYATNENTAFTTVAMPSFGMNIEVYDGTNADLASADTARNSSVTGLPTNAPQGTGALTLPTDVADFGSNGNGSYAGQNAVPAPGGGDNYAVFLTGWLKIDNTANPGNQWTFGLHADDGARIRIDLDQDGILEGSLTAQTGETVAFLSPACCAVTLGSPRTIADGYYRFEAAYSEGGGGDYGEFFYAPGNPSFSTTNYALIGDESKGIDALRVLPDGVLFNDSDEEVDNGNVAQSLSISAVNGVPGLVGFSTLGAQITMTADGGFTYNPNIPGSAVQALAEGQVANDTFIYTVTDNDPTTPLTANGTVTVTVTGRNDAPIAVNDSYTVSENAVLSATDVDTNPRTGQGDTTPGNTNDDGVLVNDIDVDATNTLTVLQSSTVSANGAAVTVNPNGTFTYDPTVSPTLQRLGAGQSLQDSFTYMMSDLVYVNDGRMMVQLLGAAAPLPGNSTPNWLNVWNAIDGGAGPTGTIAGFNIIANFSDTENSFNYAGGGDFGGTLGTDSINNNGPGGGGGYGGTDEYSVRGRTYLRFTTGGTFTIGLGSDDGRRIRLVPAIPGSAPGYSGFSNPGGQNDGITNGGTVFGWSGGTGHDWSTAQFTVAAGDILLLDAFYYEGGGGDSGEIAIAAGAFGDFTNTTDFSLLQNGVHGIQLSSIGANLSTATVTVTVNGFNEQPVANPNTYTTNEDTPISPPVVLEVPGMNVLVYNSDDTAQTINNTMPTADAARNSSTNGAPVNPPHATGIITTADIGSNGDGDANFPGQAPVPAPGGGDYYAVFLTGILRVNNSANPGSMWTFGTYADDASRIRIDLDRDGILEGSLTGLGGGEAGGGGTVAFLSGCCAASLGGPVMIPDGDYLFEAVFTEGNGGDNGEFFYAPGAVSPAFNDTNYALIGNASKGISSFASITRPGLIGNDTDEEVDNGSTSQSLTITHINGVAGLTGTSTLGAAVTANADGSFSYNPNIPGSLVQSLKAGQVANDTFTYTISDNDPVSPKSHTATATVTVTGRNDAPDAINDSYTIGENSTLVTTDQDLPISGNQRDNIGNTTPGDTTDDGVLVNDIEIDTNDVFEVTRVQNTVLSGTTGVLGNGSATATTARGASVTMNDDGTFTYNPAGSSVLQALGAGQSLVDSFTYTVTDNSFTPNGLMAVQLAASAGPGNTTANWLNVWNAIDGGAGPIGPSVGGFNVTDYRADTETLFDYAGGGNFGGTLAINSINSNGPGGGGGFGGQDGDNYSIRTKTYLRFNTGGTFTIGLGSDDGRRISLAPAFAGSAPGYSGFTAQGGQVDPFTVGGTVIGWSGGTGHNWSVGTFTVAAGDILFLDAFYYEGGGGDSGEIAIADGTFGNFTNTTDFTLLAQGVKNIDVSSVGQSSDTATVSVTVNGFNEQPVANPNTYATNEDTALNVPVVTDVPGINIFVYDGTDATIGSADTARNSSTNGAPVNPAAATATRDLADIGTNGDGSFPGQLGVPAPGGGENYAVFMTGILRVNNASNPGNQWTFGLHADDASRIRIDLDRDGILEGNLTALGGGEAGGGGTVAFLGGCCANTRFAAVTIPDGDYLFEAVYTEGGGGDYGEFFYAPGDNPAFSTSAYSLIGSQLQGISAFSSVVKTGLIGNDTDEEVDNGSVTQTLTITHINGVAGLTGTSTLGAAVTANADGSFSYNPNIPGSLVQSLSAGQVANDTFTYTISDNDPVSPKSSTVTATITVTGRNDAPDAINNTYATNEDTAITTTDQDLPISGAQRDNIGNTTPGNTADDGVLVNDIEIDTNDVFEVVAVQGTALSGTTGVLGNGSATVNSTLGASVTMNDDGTFTYNPSVSATLRALNPTQTATDSFTYTVTDNKFTPNGLMAVQLAASTGPGNTTANWLNVWNAIDSGAGPIGPSVGGFNVTDYRQDTEVAFNYADEQNFTGTFAVSSINNNGPGGTGGFGAQAGENYSIRTKTYLRFNTGGTYTIGLGSDDGRRISLAPAFAGSAPGYSGFTAQGGQVDPFTVGGTVVGWSGGTGHNWSVGTFTVAAGDILLLDAFYYEGNGGDSGEIAIANGTFGNFTNTTDFTLLAQGVKNIDVSSVGQSLDTATVTVTVQGVNDNPIAVNDPPTGVATAYQANENFVLNVPAGSTPGIFFETYRGGAINDQIVNADNARSTMTPVASATIALADITDPESHFPTGNFSHGPNPYFATFPGDVVGVDDNFYAVFGTGILRVNVAGTYTFGSSTDDNSRMRIDLDQDGVFEGTPNNLGGTESHPGGGTVAWQPTCCGNVFGTPVTLAVGFYRFEMVYTEGGGGSSGEFFYAPGSHAGFNGSFRLIGDGTGGIDAFTSISGLMLNDFDYDNGDSISVDTATITSAQGATVTPNADGSFSYDPSTSNAIQLLINGQTLLDSFVYTLEDSFGGSSTAIAFVNVAGASDPVNDSYNVNEDNPADGVDLNVPPTGTLLNDALPGGYTLEVLSAQGSNVSGTRGTVGDGSVTVATTAGGQVVIQDSGAFTYDQLGVFNGLDTGETGTDSFVYSLYPNLPTAAGTLTTTSATGVLPVSSTDLLSGLTATVSTGSVASQEGTSANTGTLTDGAFGAAGITGYPQAVAIANNTTLTFQLDTLAIPEGYDIESVSVFAAWNDDGRDRQDYTAQYSTVADPNTWINFAAVVSYDPPAGNPPAGGTTISAPGALLAKNVGRIRFVFGNQENGYVGYRELDVIGYPHASATATLNIAGVNDAPVSGGNASASGTEDDVTINGSVPAATDVDIEPLTYHIVGATPAGVTFNSDGTFSVTPLASDQGLDTSETRVFTFTYAANDGTVDSNVATVTITINGVNDAPVSGGAASASGTEDDPTINGAVPAASDIDVEPLTYHIVGATPAGVTFNSDGTFSVVPLAADQGLDVGESRVFTFTYTANDGTVDGDIATVTVTINGLNDAPVANAGGPYNINIGQDLALDASATIDVDIEPLTYMWDFDQNGTFDLITSSPTATASWTLLQSLTIPFGFGTHTINLVVNDGTVNSALVNAIVNVSNIFVFNPVADGLDDGWTLILNPAMDRIEIRDTVTTALITSAPKAGTDQVLFTGTTDDETLTIDFTYTNPIPVVGGVTFNAGGQMDDGDTLVIQNGTSTTVTHNFVTNNNGNVDIDGRVLNYTGLEPITDNLSATNRVFNYTSALAEAITFRNSVAVGFDLFLDSSVGGEQIDFVRPTATLTINLPGGGVDTVDLQTSAITGDFTLTGTGSDDVVNVTGGVTLTGATAAASITGVQSINFNGGSLTAVTTATLTASAAITTNGAGVDVAAASLVANAATGIDLDTDVTNLTAVTSGAGSITLDEANGANVLNVAAANGNATVTTATGALNVTTASASGTVTLTATTGAITDGNAGAVNATATLLDAFGATGIDLDTDIAQLTAASTNAAITIRETNGVAVNTIDAGAGDVTLTLAAGAIADNNGAGSLNVTAGLLNVTGPGGIDLNTDVTSLTASSTGTAIVIREASAVAVNTVNAGAGTVSLAAGGAVTDGNAAANNVTAASFLVTAAGGIALETTVGQIAAANTTSGDIAITNTGALNITTLSEPSIGSVSGVTNPAGSVTVIALSPLTVSSPVSAAGAVVLTASDNLAAGDNLTINAIVTSTGSSITLNAGDAASVTANLSASTTVAINIDAGDADPGVGNGGSLNIGGAVVITATGATFTGAGQGDVFAFAPQVATPINVFGLAPAANPDGDTLTLDTSLATNPTLNILGGQGSGLYTFGNRASVQYSSIENGGATTPYHISLDATATGIENIRLQRSNEAAIGANFEVYNSNTNDLLYGGLITNVLSFTFLGSLNANTVTIDDTNGLVDLAGAVPAPTGVGDNGNVAGTPEVFLRGNGGTDAIVFENRQDATDQIYGLGTGAAAGSQAGEVRTTNGPRVLSVYFDGVEGVVSNDATPADTGTLTIVGDANPNTITLASSAGGTTLNMAGGYVPFTFAPQSFNAAIVTGGDGNDAITLQSLNAAEAGLALALNGEIGNDTISVEAAPAGSTLALQGGVGNDAYQLGGAANLVDNILIPITIADTSGTDSLTLNDSADGTGDTVTVTDSTIDGVNGAPSPNVSFSSIETLDVTTTGGADTITTTLNGTNGLVTVNVRGAANDDDFFLNTADNMTTLTTVNLVGDTGNDEFGSAMAPIRPLAGTTTNLFLYGDTTAITTNPGGAVFDRLYLDMNATSAGLPTNPLVIVDTVTGQATTANTRLLRFGGMEDIDLYDGGQLTDVVIGDLYLRATDQVDNLVFYREAGGVFIKRNGVVVSAGAYAPTNRIVSYGRGGNDYMEFNFTLGSTLGADFRGEDNNDTLVGGLGSDLLVGGGGNDTLRGGEGNDTLYGEDQFLTTSLIAYDVQRATGLVVSASGGADTLDGGGGNDFLFGGTGADNLNGGLGNDYVHGGEGNDTLNSGGGNDILRGEAGADLINGAEGADILLGGSGDDRIFGRGNRDFLLAGAGADQIQDDEASNDVVVAGGLLHDNDNSFASIGASLTGLNDYDLALQAMMFTGPNAWSGAALFATRVGNLTPLTAIINDTVADIILGNVGGQDYIISNTNDMRLNTTGDQLLTV